jgi:hypothetical protein
MLAAAIMNVMYRILGFPIVSSLIELSPSGEAANCAATQEFPNILWNPKDQSNPYHPILSL